MLRAKQFIHYFDLFAVTTFQRCKGNDYYSTLTGGIISILLLITFFALYVNQSINTVNKDFIQTQFVSEYDEAQDQSVLVANQNSNFMFAVGISGLDLSSKTRYFDIVMTNVVSLKEGNNKTYQNVVLSPCRKQHWQNFDKNIASKFWELSLYKWLCPEMNATFPLKGKYSSDIFKYSKILVRRCTANQSLFPSTSCANSSQMKSFVESKKHLVFNFYYVNSAIYGRVQNFVDHYLEDRNQFLFDTKIGTTANLFFEEYQVSTDLSYMPWQELNNIKGLLVNQQASNQLYMVQQNSTKSDYLEFYLRKGYFKYHYERSFKKFDQIFAYVGGLLSTMLAVCFFLRIYNRYCYQLQMGDQMFKQKNNASFGSENFNFVVFIGYAVYVLFTKLKIYLRWNTMKKFHECKIQCEKQLNIDLQTKKITHFQEISKVFLEEYHRNLLLMVPKPTISEARLHRKKFEIKDLIYHQIQRIAREIYVDQSVYKQKWLQYIDSTHKKDRDKFSSFENDSEESSALDIHKRIKVSYEKLKGQLQSQQPHSKRVLQLLGSNNIAKMIYGTFQRQDSEHIYQKNQFNESENSLGKYIQKNEARLDMMKPNQSFQNLNLEGENKLQDIRQQMQILAENKIDLKFEE